MAACHGSCVPNTPLITKSRTKLILLCDLEGEESTRLMPDARRGDLILSQRASAWPPPHTHSTPHQVPDAAKCTSDVHVSSRTGLVRG